MTWSPRPDTSSWPTAATLGLVAAAVVAVAFLVAPTSSSDVVVDDDVVTEQASAGAWYCPPETFVPPAEDPFPAGEATATPTAPPDAEGDDAEDASDRASEEPTAAATAEPALPEELATSVVAVRAPDGSQPAEWTARAPGDAGISQLGEVFPGSSQTVTTDPDGTVEVRWSGQPVSVHRLTTIADEPSAALARPCIADVSRNWYVPGLTTASGVQATLHVTNPLSQDAAVAVEGLTPQGRENPLRLQNLSVPAGTTRVVDVNAVLPQVPDLALHVVARSGRVAVSGLLESEATVSGVAGRSAVQAVPEPATRWFVPWATTTDHTDGGGTPLAEVEGPPSEQPAPDETEEPTEAATSEATSAPEDDDAGDAGDDDILDVTVEGDAVPSTWLWLANPDPDATATVSLAWLTSRGRESADVLGTVEVGPSGLRRINLDELVPDTPGDVGIDVQVTNDVPIVASRAMVVDAGDDATRTGFTAVPAVGLADDAVTVTTIGGDDREHWLTLANPYGETATVDLDVWNGTTSRSPDQLQGLEVPAGATVSLDMTAWATDADVFTVFVRSADGGVAASLRSRAPEGNLEFTLVDGVPDGIWTSSGSALSVDEQNGLVNRLGTGLGLPVELPTETPLPVPSDVATPRPSTATETPTATPAPTGTGVPTPSPTASPADDG